MVSHLQEDVYGNNYELSQVGMTKNRKISGDNIFFFFFRKFGFNLAIKTSGWVNLYRPFK